MANGHEHNRRVAWVRMWAAIGAAAIVDRSVALGRSVEAVELAKEYARWEARRLAEACYALGTTSEV